MALSLSQQIEEVQRELRFRRDVYPRQVSSGKLRKSEAEYHMARMEAVLTTLQWLERNEAKIKLTLTECT